MRRVENPPNPWLRYSIEWLGEPPAARLEVFEEDATRTIVTRNNSPDVGFDCSVNCYRGCPHACSYCFSRPTHEYLGYGAGTDFERKIVVKINAPKLLREEFLKPAWKGELLAFSFTSDPYLPLEAEYGLTRKCLAVCLEFRNPVSIITKSALIRRDKDLIAELARETEASVFFSIPFLDYETARALEPFAPSPEARFRAMEELAACGIPVGLAIAPVILGLNDSQIPALMNRARECGARRAFLNLLRLPGSVAPYFEQRLREQMPLKAERILHLLREARGGRMNVSEFGARMQGRSEHWRMVEQLFAVSCRKFGFNQKGEDCPSAKKTNTFRRPNRQIALFE
jgi:DNA repair photolyase